MIEGPGGIQMSEILVTAIGVIQAGLVGAIWYKLGRLGSNAEAFWRSMDGIAGRVKFLEEKAMEGERK